MSEVDSALRRIDDAVTGGGGSRNSIAGGVTATKTRMPLGLKPKSATPGALKVRPSSAAPSSPRV